METDAVDDTEEELWKNVLHCTIAKICQETAANYNVTFNADFSASFTDLTFRHIQISAEDLEMFARHGKRSTINTDDVKLLVRKSPSLYEHIENYVDEIVAASNQAKKQKKKPSESKSDKTDAPANKGKSKKQIKKTKAN